MSKLVLITFHPQVMVMEDARAAVTAQRAEEGESRTYLRCPINRGFQAME